MERWVVGDDLLAPMVLCCKEGLFFFVEGPVGVAR